MTSSFTHIEEVLDQAIVDARVIRAISGMDTTVSVITRITRGSIPPSLEVGFPFNTATSAIASTRAGMASRMSMSNANRT